MDAQQRSFPAQHLLIRQGDIGDVAWLIENGTLEVLLNTNGQTRRLSVVGKHAVIGEMALIDGGPRSATVRTLSPVSAIEISRPLFGRMIATSEPLARLLLVSLVGAIRGAYDLPLNDPPDLAMLAEIRSSAGYDKVLERRVYPDERVLFNAGDQGSVAYLIQSGAVRIHRGDQDLLMLGPGRIFGELALLSDRPRAASATVSGMAVCELIRKVDFQHAIASMPPILRALTRIYIEQLSSRS